MKIVRIANLAIAVILASVAASCVKETPQEETPETPVSFTVELNKADADYAEVVVRHDGEKDASWYGFVTTDLESSVESLIQSQLGNVNQKSLHIGTAQTVALRNLDEYVNYRYIAFGVGADGVRYGTPGYLAFNTSPYFNVVFEAKAGAIDSHKASFSVSHDGIDVLTYMAFITDDTETDLSNLASSHYASLLNDKGKLNEGVELFSGTAGEFTFDGLTHETDYRFVVYGIYDNNGTVIYYGTPSEVKFATPIDLSIVEFSAVISDISTNSAKAKVTYEAKQSDLTWYGFTTDDLTTSAGELAAAKVAGLSQSDLATGKNKTLELTGLNVETTYRFIVTGVNANGEAFGIPADIRFQTMSQAYVDAVFTVEASDITSTGATLTITHNGLDEFQYCGFFTQDLASDVADIALPSNPDANLMTGNGKAVTFDNLSPVTTYRYVVVGRYNGNEYGKRGEVVFTTADNAVALSYEDFIGEWKLNGQIFSVSQKVSGVSYTIDGLPGSSSTRCGISAIEGLYDSEKGVLYVMDQDLAQYNDPSTNNYGPLKDFYAGAKWTTMSSGTERYWAQYPFRRDAKARIFNFIGLDDGTYVLRAEGDIEAALFGWVILTGSNAGAGNCYSGEIIFPASVTKFEKKPASYSDFLGTWQLGSNVITISQKVAGSTYSVSGLFNQDSINGTLSEIVANFDSDKKEFYLMEQKLGEWEHSSYGMCDDYLAGYFPYNTAGYFAYPFNTDAPNRIFTAYFTANGDVEITPGSCSYGSFSKFDFIWVIREGENAGNGNNYSTPDKGTDIPEKLVKVGGGSSTSSVSSSSARAAGSFTIANSRAPQLSSHSIVK